MKRFAMIGAALALALGTVSASGQADAVETAELGKSTVTLHPRDFLTAEELALLRLVLVNDQALAVFVQGGAGHAALAVAPAEGLIRAGKPVASAVALSELPDADTAAAEALKACEAARSGGAACEIVLEVETRP
ncbi:hypothetical protein [Pseudogemmobacter sonorensis]|uniref:hypothetical protein n=1 Tax=Pseudogemmobacter sonorensis TaxID=2989681 RepID=UPI0036A77CDA